MSRWKAAGIHLLISVLVGLGLLALFFWVWYPGPLFSASGGDRLILLIIGIDLVAGPLLTLIVFESGKRTLRFDLTCIAVAQIAFLLFGVWTAVQARPVYIAYARDRFVVVPANALDAADLAAAAPEYQSLPWLGPEPISLHTPTDQQELLELIQSAMQGKDAERYPKYYRPYEEVADQVIARAHSMRLLEDLPPAAQARLEQIRSEHPELGFYPTTARTRTLTALVDMNSGALVDFLDFDPWSRVAGPQAPPLPTPNEGDLLRALGAPEEPTAPAADAPAAGDGEADASEGETDPQG